MEKLFTGIYDYFKNNRIVLYAVFLISGLAFAYFALRVKFVEDISAIIPRDAKTEKLNQVFQNSKFADKLIIAVSLKNDSLVQPDSLVLYADTLAAHMQDEASAYIKDIHYKIEDDFSLDLFQTIQEHLPVFLSEIDYASVDTLTDPEIIKTTLAHDISLFSSPSGMALKILLPTTPAGFRSSR